MPEVPKLLHDLVLYILKVGLCGKKKKKKFVWPGEHGFRPELDESNIQ